MAAVPFFGSFSGSGQVTEPFSQAVYAVTVNGSTTASVTFNLDGTFNASEHSSATANFTLLQDPLNSHAPAQFSQGESDDETLSGNANAVFGLFVNTGDATAQFAGAFNAGHTQLQGTVTFNFTGFNGGVDAPITLNATQAGVAANYQTVAVLASDAYKHTFTGGNGWTPTASKTDGEFQAVAYTNADGSEVSIAIRGTDFAGLSDTWFGIKNLLTDVSSFPTGAPSAGLRTMVTDASQFLAQTVAAHPNAKITLTGHSLGGAVAQLVAKASGYSAITYNAPGALQLYPNLQAELAPALALNHLNPDPDRNVNYRAIGDAISLFGTPVGTTYTLVPAANPRADVWWNFLANHNMDGAVIADLNAAGTQRIAGVVEPSATVLGVTGLLEGVVAPSAFGKAVTSFAFTANAAANLFDPATGTQFVFAESGASPAITSVTFAAHADVATFKVWSAVGNTWSGAQSVAAGTAANLPTGTTAFKYAGISASGAIVSLPDGFVFDATFASAAQVSASIATIDGHLRRVSDLTSDGVDDVLFQSKTTGQVLFAKMVGGAFQVWGIDTGPLGTDWKVVASGDVNPGATGGAETFVQQQSTGTIYYSSLDTGGVTWGVVSSSLSADWKLRTVADVNGDASFDAIVQNQTTGTVYYADMNGGAFHGWGVVNQFLTADWKAAAAADINGDGFADVVVQQQSTGTIFYASMKGGVFSGWSVVSNRLTADWQAKIAADVTGDGFADVVIQSQATGTTYYADMKNGQFDHWGVVAQNAGPTWVTKVAADVDADGRPDVVFQNSVNGTTYYAHMTANGFDHWGVVAANITTDWLVV